MTKKNYQQLSESERHAIALGLQQKQSLSAIARALGRSKSAISRECQRNAGAKGYVSKFAQQRSSRRRCFARPQPKLHPENKRQQVSHESIYTCIYAQPRGELKKELVACLRMARAKRWPRSRGEDRRGQITDLLSIARRIWTRLQMSSMGAPG